MSAWRDEFRVRHPAKGEIWVEGHSMPQLEADGTLLWHGYIQDVSERKHTEQALRESEARFRQLAESLPQLVWTCTAEGACDYLSPQWVAYTGIPEAPQLGDGWLQQVHPNDRRRVMDAWNRGSPAGRSYDIEFRIRRGDGAYRWFRTRAAPLCDGTGRIVRWFGTNTDIDDLKQAEDALRHANESLERRVAERTTELQASALALRQTTEQLQRLSAHLDSVREDQNARIAREIHDELGGTLTMLKLGLSLALEQCADAGAENQIRTMLKHADEAIRAVKRISTNLRPPMLDTLGLVATIGWYAADFSWTTGIRTDVTLPKAVSLQPERATAVFRIVQEALTNVARHAEAGSATIVLRKRQGRLILEIGDDGKGVPTEVAQNPGGLGIIGMQERARLLGGELRMLPRRPRGTTLRLDIPLERR
jgi:PAS domain S-box-containing protein